MARSVLLSVLLVSFVLVACGGGSDDVDETSAAGTEQTGEPCEGSEPLTVTEDGSTILVGDSWKCCETVDDCVQILTSCDGCCGREAITQSLEQQYAEVRPGLCEPYMGGECDCEPLPTELACVEGLCELVPL